MSDSFVDKKVSQTEKYLDADFAKWLDSLLLQNHQPGLSIAVIRDGQIESSGYGFAQLPGIHATSDTLWTMASTTKAFTTTLLEILLQKQNSASSQPIAWSTPVSQILSDFVTTDDYVTKHATIEDIASHRSGVAGHDLVWGPVTGSSLSTATRCLRYFEEIEGKFRSTWQYNNLLYAVLGDIIEHISGETYEDILKAEILDILDMKDTWLGMRRVIEQVQRGTLDRSRLARGYYPLNSANNDDGATGSYTPDQYTDLTGVEPAGALVSTVKDYAKWVAALLRVANSRLDNSNTSTEGEFISRKSWKELTTPRIQLTSAPFESTITPARPSDYATPLSYCLGWLVDPYMYPGEVMIQHSGGLPGFSSSVAMLPDRNIGIVVVGNGGMAGLINEAVTKELFGRRLGLSKEERRSTVQKDTNEKDEISTEIPLQDVPIADAAGEANLHSRTHGEELMSPEAIQFEGFYVHPAYGTFHVTAGPSSTVMTGKEPNIGGVRIIRQTDSKDQKSDSAMLRGQNYPASFLVTPLGNRGLIATLILHPKSTQPYADKRLFDLETLYSHGDLSRESMKGLEPTTHHTDNVSYPLKPAVVWQSMHVKKAAAVFELVQNTKTDVPRVGRLGLRVMRVDGAADQKKKTEDGSTESGLESGWETRMIWMSKLYT